MKLIVQAPSRGSWVIDPEGVNQLLRSNIIANYELRIANCKLRIANCKLCIANCFCCIICKNMLFYFVDLCNNYLIISLHLCIIYREIEWLRNQKGEYNNELFT